MDNQKQPSAMKLTPIRMRGKRKSNRTATGSGIGSSSSYPNSDSDTAAATAALTLSSPSSPLKRSRASSSTSQKKSALSSSSLSASAPARRARTKKPVPFDQRFPLEVIERIFFYSKNFNLPRASPRFGWMLSSRHTLRDLVFAAFGPQWDLTLTQKRYKRPRRNDKTGARKAQARLNDVALQTAVLNSPWMKMDLVVEAMQIWLQKNRDKKYLHTPIPFAEDPDRSRASKFVLNLDDFDALLKEHPTEHILSMQMLDRTGMGDSDEEEEEEEDEDENQDEDGDSAEVPDRSSEWDSDYDSDHISDKDSDESEQEDDNEDNEQENKTVTENPTNYSAAPRVSAHACFAIDQYSFLENMYHVNIHDPKPHETPSALLFASFEGREGEEWYQLMDGVALIGYRMTVGTTFLRGPSLGKAQIPEWLQLAGGPYPASRNQGRQGRKALRDRLRATFDMLSWIVFAGGKLQKNDGWELTWQGYQNLLALDVRRNDWDAYEDGEEVVAACEHVSADPGRKTIRLQYSVDTLVSGLLGLFYSLGVFYHQMPQHILESAMEMATDRASSGGVAFRETQTYLILRRIAFLIPPNNKKSFLGRLPESFGIKF